MKEPDQNEPPGGGAASESAASGEQRKDGEFVAPLGSSRGGRLVFASGASRLTVHAEPSMADLFRARFEGQVPRVGAENGTVTIRYPRFLSLLDWLNYSRELLGGVVLNASVPWDVEVRDGASRLTADLRGLELGSFVVSGGASRVEVMLPRPSGIVPVRILGGASNLIIHRPEGVAAQLRVGGGSTNLAFDEQRLGAVGGEVSLQSPDYEGASDRYDITITGGASSVTIDAT